MAARISRSLSRFNPTARRWIPIASNKARNQTVEGALAQKPSPISRFSLITWNIDFASPRPIARANRILNHILDKSKSPDIIFLQEVTSDVRASLLVNPRVREAFLTTAAEDNASFEDGSYGTMTLLSNTRFALSLNSQQAGDGVEGEEKFALGPVSSVQLPSAYGRDGLCVDIVHPSAPDAFYRLINVHLDSLGRLDSRRQQLEILAGVLREPGCRGGLIAGDFNSIRPQDQALVEGNGLEDAWLALHGDTDPDAPTWSARRNRDGLIPKRLDKVAMMGLRAEEIEVLCPGVIEVPKPDGESDWLKWSDHSGLRCTFTI